MTLSWSQTKLASVAEKEKTISQYPLAIGDLLRRRAQRLARRERLRRLFTFSRPRSRTHVARISPSETVFSNLPLR